MRSALFGRCCVSLHKLDKGTMQQCFKVGDEASLCNPKLASSCSTSDGDQYVLFGLVSKMSHNTIEIIFDEFDPPLCMDLRSSQKAAHLKAAHLTLSTRRTMPTGATSCG